jgi:transposase-like protein
MRDWDRSRRRYRCPQCDSLFDPETKEQRYCSDECEVSASDDESDTAVGPYD